MILTTSAPGTRLRAPQAHAPNTMTNYFKSTIEKKIDTQKITGQVNRDKSIFLIYYN